ncbi:hypothetical protein QYF61_005121 [Mycteria americana]|uniref:Uncharacterized protein n=1 Tax=Mycteria americana TaxID=33587 RepID=A0AAN7NJK6_MYCAM|nr:hypothetical protein QYF61_005121 [Mycteria americana]
MLGTEARNQEERLLVLSRAGLPALVTTKAASPLGSGASPTLRTAAEQRGTVGKAPEMGTETTWETRASLLSGRLSWATGGRHRRLMNMSSLSSKITTLEVNSPASHPPPPRAGFTQVPAEPWKGDTSSPETATPKLEKRSLAVWQRHVTELQKAAAGIEAKQCLFAEE